jgi:hypothetical protein
MIIGHIHHLPEVFSLYHILTAFTILHLYIKHSSVIFMYYIYKISVSPGFVQQLMP